MPTFSVFTPSHDPKYLDDCYASLKAQTLDDWEWVVLLNGGAKWEKPKDRRVLVAETGEKMGVGKAKQEAVKMCTAEWLVELDHDDELSVGALAWLDFEIKQQPEAVFFYSDFEQMNEDGSVNYDRFDPIYGWEYSEQRCRGFEPFPSAVSYIWYAPNHLRMFSRAAYDAVGGYDGTLEVLDDQDLMARLYQHGGFVYVPISFYRQRVHPGNTQRRSDLNAKIQSETVTMYDRDIEANALAWAGRNGLPCLDLGGAHNSPPGYLSVDLHDADLSGDVFDVLAGIADNGVGVVRAVDFLEHVSDPVRLMNELYRVLAHGGMLLSLTPSTDGRGAWQDPTHVQGWNENSFWYYTDSEYAKYIPEIECRFQVSRLVTYWPSDWHEWHKIDYVCANLVAVKDGPRLPGVLSI